MNTLAVTIYEYANTVLIVPLMRTVAGFDIEGEPVLKAPADDCNTIGNHCLQALQQFRSDVEIPKPYKWNTFLAAGVKTGRQFQMNSRCCGLIRVENSWSICPTRNLGAREGFEPMPNEQITETFLPEAHTLGMLVKRGLLLCEKG